MTIRETPPQKGLTRRNTGFLHPLFPGWYMTKTAVRDTERLNRHRHQEAPAVPVTDDRPQKTCFSCGRTYREAMGQKSGKCPRCRAKAGSVSVRRTCPNCENTFVQTTSGPTQKWCSERCRLDGNKKLRHQQAKAEKRTCVACGETFITRPDKDGRMRSTCSTSCRTRAGHVRKRRERMGEQA